MLNNCSKPKTVLICGDHICINKSEAEQYFEENLSIEVKIIDKKNKEKISLVELNLRNGDNKNKQILINDTQETKEVVKVLSNDEIKIIKNEIKEKKKSVKVLDSKIVHNKNKSIKNSNEIRTKVVDICTIVKKCSIDEISKYLLKRDKKKGFPDITIRE